MPRKAKFDWTAIDHEQFEDLWPVLCPKCGGQGFIPPHKEQQCDLCSGDGETSLGEAGAYLAKIVAPCESEAANPQGEPA